MHMHGCTYFGKTNKQSFSRTSSPPIPPRTTTTTGGVAGGSILQGVLKLGDSIEVRPGIVTKVGRCARTHARV